MTPVVGGLRVGVDVGGTFTKAVAVTTKPVGLRAHAVVPTTHHAPNGVVEGVAEALRQLLEALGDERASVDLVAYSTTTAMNALLEGDVARVGVVGIGAAPEQRKARKRTKVGDLPLAAGRVLHTEHAFLDATGGLTATAVDAVVEDLQRRGCTAIAVSGAYSVDAPEHEDLVVARARALGLPACAGHELTGTYGLEVRTVSAAVNASILPVVERTANVVEQVLHAARIDVPLLVLRGDGGAMSLNAFRGAPSMSIGSGPAAGVAAALHQLALTEGIVLECGGTSSNVTVVKGGRTVLRDLRVMGRPTSIRSIDSWVVGAAGGSMARLGRRRVEEVGPRSAHVADLDYACFASPEDLRGAEADLVAPRDGDPEAYAVVHAPDGRRWAITATCAANALGLVHDTWAAGNQDTARMAFAALGARLRQDEGDVAQAVLDGAVQKIAEAVAEAARAHDLGPEVPVVALGGSGAALAPEVARRLGRPLLLPDHAEVLSSIGAALSLVRTEVVRHADAATSDRIHIAHEAQRACVEAGAAPMTVTVQTFFEPRDHLLRAVATGAVALESGAASREPLDEAGQREAAAAVAGTEAASLELVAETGYYRVFSDERTSSVAVVDDCGAVPVCDRARRVVKADSAKDLLDVLGEAVERATTNLGIAALVPRVCIVSGAHVVDLSDSRRTEEIVAGAAAVLDGSDGPAVAMVWS